jgi:hypothetical protein
MEHHHRAVPSQMDVTLETIDAQLQSIFEGPQAILRPRTRAASMGCHQHPRSLTPPQIDGHLHPDHFSTALRPFTSPRCISRIATTGGNRAIIAPAMIGFQGGSSVPLRGISPSSPREATAS